MRKIANSPYQVGGLYLIKRRDYFYIHGNDDNGRIRVATKTHDLRIAKKALDDLASEFDSEWRDNAEDGSVSWQSVAKWMCERHRRSSKARGMPFEITAPDVYKALREANFRCAVSGIALSRRVGPNGPPDPWAARLDRIENRHGYVRGNFRIVCLAANLAMNRWGYDTMLRLASAVVQNATKALPEKAETLTPFLITPIDDPMQVIDKLEETG
jgi:hypothetical protein